MLPNNDGVVDFDGDNCALNNDFNGNECDGLNYGVLRWAVKDGTEKLFMNIGIVVTGPGTYTNEIN